MKNRSFWNKAAGAKGKMIAGAAIAVLSAVLVLVVCTKDPASPECPSTKEGCPGYVDPCVANPTPNCPGYCTANPNDAQCVSFCDNNPFAEGCPRHCDQNPEEKPTCPEYCPSTQPACPAYCTLHPSEQICAGDPCATNPTSNCPGYCQQSPRPSDCPDPTNPCSINGPGAECNRHCLNNPDSLECRNNTCTNSPSITTCGKDVYCGYYGNSAEGCSTEVDPCIANPTPGCSNYCDVNPTNKPECPGYCTAHPNADECVNYNPCANGANEECCYSNFTPKPTGPNGCMCWENQLAQGCLGNPCETGTNEECCVYDPNNSRCKQYQCQINPTYGCPGYCDTYPNDAQCLALIKDWCYWEPNSYNNCSGGCSEIGSAFNIKTTAQCADSSGEAVRSATACNGLPLTGTDCGGGGGGTGKWCYWAPNSYNDCEGGCSEIGGQYSDVKTDVECETAYGTPVPEANCGTRPITGCDGGGGGGGYCDYGFGNCVTSTSGTCDQYSVATASCPATSGGQYCDYGQPTQYGNGGCYWKPGVTPSGTQCGPAGDGDLEHARVVTQAQCTTSNTTNSCIVEATSPGGSGDNAAGCNTLRKCTGNNIPAGCNPNL